MTYYQNKYFIIIIFIIFIGTKESLSEMDNSTELINKTSNYLDNINSLKSKFVQVDQFGNSSSGNLYIKKPGKMRIEYDDPTKILIVVDGFYFIYVDLEIDQATYTDLNESPAKYLLDPKWSFKSNSVKIDNVTTNGDIIQIAIKPSNDSSEENLTFIFKDNPLELRQWKIVDSQNNSVTVTLYDIEVNKNIDLELFKYQDKSVFEKN